MTRITFARDARQHGFRRSVSPEWRCFSQQHHEAYRISISASLKRLKTCCFERLSCSPHRNRFDSVLRSSSKIGVAILLSDAAPTLQTSCISFQTLKMYAPRVSALRFGWAIAFSNV